MIFKFIKKIITPLLLLCLIVACQQQNSSTATATKATKTTTKTTKPKVENGFTVTKSGKKIAKAEKGITVVSEDGWTDSEMTFQIDYCQQMMGNIETIDGEKFCKCFLDKIQYYYKPIYARDAFDDQKKWNQECFQEAEI